MVVSDRKLQASCKTIELLCICGIALNFRGDYEFVKIERRKNLLVRCELMKLRFCFELIHDI